MISAPVSCIFTYPPNFSGRNHRLCCNSRRVLVHLYFAFGTSRIAPLFPEVTMAAYLARYPVVTFGSRGCHFAFLACISSSETLISSFSSGMLMLMISPSSTSAIGPPTAASGDTCPMDAPLDAPLKRPSVIRLQKIPVPYLRLQM